MRNPRGELERARDKLHGRGFSHRRSKSTRPVIDMAAHFRPQKVEELIKINSAANAILHRTT